MVFIAHRATSRMSFTRRLSDNIPKGTFAFDDFHVWKSSKRTYSFLKYDVQHSEVPKLRLMGIELAETDKPRWGDNLGVNGT